MFGEMDCDELRPLAHNSVTPTGISVRFRFAHDTGASICAGATASAPQPRATSSAAATLRPLRRAAGVLPQRARVSACVIASTHPVRLRLAVVFDAANSERSAQGRGGARDDARQQRGRTQRRGCGACWRHLPHTRAPPALAHAWCTREPPNERPFENRRGAAQLCSEPRAPRRVGADTNDVA